jgi:predicted glycosyltransferase
MPSRLDYVGVVARPPLPPVEADATTVVAMPGGGASGAQLFPLLVSALRPLLLSEGVRLRYVVGPYGSAAALDVPEELRGRIELVAEGSAEETVRDASLVVSRVGYNTSYSLVQTDLPLVFVPTPTPGDEQIYRAGKLTQLSNVSVVEETSPQAAELLRAAVRSGLAAGKAKRELPFRVDGARRAAAWLAALAGAEAGVS